MNLLAITLSPNHTGGLELTAIASQVVPLVLVFGFRRNIFRIGLFGRVSGETYAENGRKKGYQIEDDHCLHFLKVSWGIWYEGFECNVVLFCCEVVFGFGGFFGLAYFYTFHWESNI